MNKDFSNTIEDFLSFLKKVDAVKKFYRYPEPKTQEEKLIPLICTDTFDLDLFSKAIKSTYSDYISLFFESQYLWKITADKELIGDIKVASYKVKEGINKVSSYWHELTNKEKGNLVLIHDLMLVCLIDQSNDGEISELQSEEIDKSDEKEKRYYRGHSDYTYGVLPTMLRGVNPPKSNIIDYDFVKKAYKEASLENRYTECIGSTLNSYRYCAFMQHSREYSPLLDFTEDINISISFACSNISAYNDYKSKDAAILELDIPEQLVVKEEEECNRLIRSLDICVCRDKLSFSTLIRGKLLAYCTKEDFETKAHLIDLKTNDRMRYQKGCFLLFSKAVITSNDVLIPAGLETHIKKYKIPKNKKKELYERIKKERHQIDVEHLMDPYKYFFEAPIEW